MQAPVSDQGLVVGAVGRENFHEYIAALHFGILCGSLLPLSLVTSWGPCNDKREAKAVITQAFEILCPHDLLADAGCDAKWVHELCHDEWREKRSGSDRKFYL